MPPIGQRGKRLDYVVTFTAQPLGETTTGAAIDKESHDPVSRTASRESFAIAACA
jgi:hypothetical protein